MKKVLVHIGLHKTGTTWLQNELFTSQNDVFEPFYEANTAKGHSTLAEDFIFDQNKNLLNSFDSNSEIINDSLQSILEKKKDCNKVFVMSHERLSGYPSSSAFDGSIIARRIKNIFPAAKILIVIREQVSCILSNYFQYLKEGGTKDLTNYLSTKYDGRTPGFSESYFNYHHLINFYQNLFGKEHVLVLTYELFNSNKALFFQMLGEHVNETITTQTENFKKPYNIKKNHFVDYKFRFLNKYIKSSSSLNGSSRLKFYTSKKIAIKLKRFVSYFSSEKLNQSIKNDLKKEIEQWSVGRFEKSNKITKQLTNLKLEEFGYKVSK